MFPTMVEKEAVRNAAMVTSALKNGRHTSRCGYMATEKDASKARDHIGPCSTKTVHPVEPTAIRNSGNAVADCIWKYGDIADYMQPASVFIKQRLKGFGCTDAKLSPFVKVNWEKTDQCLAQLHQLLRLYRSNSSENTEEEIHTSLLDLLDEGEDDRQREERVHQALLNDLLREEKDPLPEDLEDLTSMKSIADIDDDSSIDLIDDLENLLNHDKVTTVCQDINNQDAYHRIMWKLLINMLSSDRMEFVHVILQAMSELAMHDCEKGIESLETKQKTLLLCWVVDHPSASINNLGQDKRLTQNVVVKLFNKRGKTKMLKNNKKKKRGQEIEIHSTSVLDVDGTLLRSGHYRILCAYDTFYNEHYPRLKRDDGRCQPNKTQYRPIVQILVELVDDQTQGKAFISLHSPTAKTEGDRVMMVDVSEVA